MKKAPSAIAAAGALTGAPRCDCRYRPATIAADPPAVAFPRIASRFVVVALHRRPSRLQHHPNSPFTLTSTSRSSKSRSVVVFLHRQSSRLRPDLPLTSTSTSTSSPSSFYIV
ncbi:hypothetical protein Dimus_023918 [Dionaea muscipula]